MNIRHIIFILAFIFIPTKDQSASAGNSKNSKSHIYQFKNDTLVQTITVAWQNKNSIRFHYIVINTNRNDSVKFSGIAKNHNPDMDSDIEEDDQNGESYPSVPYIFEQKGCYLSISIEFDNKHRAVIESGECPKYLNPFCPINSQGVLRLAK
jgi:hypothetical protein